MLKNIQREPGVYTFSELQAAIKDPTKVSSEDRHRLIIQHALRFLRAHTNPTSCMTPDQKVTVHRKLVRIAERLAISDIYLPDGSVNGLKVQDDPEVDALGLSINSFVLDCIDCSNYGCPKRDPDLIKSDELVRK